MNATSISWTKLILVYSGPAIVVLSLFLPWALIGPFNEGDKSYMWDIFKEITEINDVYYPLIAGILGIISIIIITVKSNDKKVKLIKGYLALILSLAIICLSVAFYNTFCWEYDTLICAYLGVVGGTIQFLNQAFFF